MQYIPVFQFSVLECKPIDNDLKSTLSLHIKVEKIYEDSLDSIPSPSVKIQIMGGKGVKAKHCWMLSTNF